MHVTLYVQPDAARALQHQQQVTPAASELLRATRQLGVVLEPMYPGEEAAYLAPYFTVEVSDAVAAKRVIDRLQDCRAVEAAYMKPSGEPP